MSGAISDAALVATNLWQATETVAQIYKDFVVLKAAHYSVKEQLFAATFSHSLLKAVCNSERLTNLNDVLATQKLALGALNLDEFIEKLEAQYGSPPDTVQSHDDNLPAAGIGRLIDPGIEANEEGMEEDLINSERLKHPLDHVGAVLDMKTWTNVRSNLLIYLDRTYGRAMSDPITVFGYAASDKKKIAEALAGLETIQQHMSKWFKELDPEPVESFDDVGTILPQAVVIQPSTVIGEMVKRTKPTFFSRVKSATLYRGGTRGGTSGGTNGDDYIYGTFEPVIGDDFKFGDRVVYKKRGNALIELVFVKGDTNSDGTYAKDEWRIQGVNNDKDKIYAKCMSGCMLAEHTALSEWQVLQTNGSFLKVPGFRVAVDDHVHLLEKKDRDRRVAFVSTLTFDTLEKAKAVIELVTDQHALGQVTTPGSPRTSCSSTTN